MSLLTRYQDGYLVARTIDATGQTVKVVGFVVAALIGVGGWVLAAKIGIPYAFAGLFLGALVALPFYALGTLVAAQGQILMATLDTAVNSSPILSPDQIRQILTGSTSAAGAQQPARRDVARPDGQCPACSAPYWYADYRSDAPQILCGSCRAELPKQPATS